MITGVHTMLYTSDAEGLRSFLRDKLGFRGYDIGEGFVIFDLPPAEMGCHPTEKRDGTVPSGTHDVSFSCDDIEQTVAELKARGVEFTRPIEDEGYGRVTFFKVPGGFEMLLYQPHYAKG